MVRLYLDIFRQSPSHTGAEFLHLEQCKVVFSEPFPLPVMLCTILLSPSHEVNHHISLRGRSMPHFSARLSSLLERSLWPMDCLFPDRRWEITGAGYSLLTSRLLPKAEWCGTAPCGDGKTFCVCWFALAWPLSACEGCTMSKWSLLAHGVSWGDGLPKITNTPSLLSQDSCTWPMCTKKVACPCSSTLCSLSPLQIARVKPTAALSPPPASKSFLPAGESPEHVFLEIILQGMAQAWGVV